MTPNTDTDTRTVDITSFTVLDTSGPYVVKNIDTGYLTIGDKTYKDTNNAKIVHTGTADSDSNQYIPLSFSSLAITCTNEEATVTPILCFKDITLNKCALLRKILDNTNEDN